MAAATHRVIVRTENYKIGKETATRFHVEMFKGRQKLESKSKVFTDPNKASEYHAKLLKEISK
jgi:hypothetical protein